MKFYKKLNILEVKEMKKYFKSLFAFIFVFGLFCARRLVLLLVMCTKRPTMALERMRSWLMHRPLRML